MLQQLVNGLTLGAVYTLIALSFSLVMGILGVLNLAIAELFMLGGYFGFAVIMAQLPLPLALVAGMAGAAIVAIVIEKLGYQPFRTAPVVTPMLSTLGFSIILQNVATNVWGSDPLQLTDEVLGAALYASAASASAPCSSPCWARPSCWWPPLAFVVQRTSIGRALRAVAENRDVARLLGVSASRVTLIAFMLSGALAGAAGVLIGLHYAAITPYIGVEIGLKAIAVMVIGGTTRIWGALIAGPLIGVARGDDGRLWRLADARLRGLRLHDPDPAAAPARSARRLPQRPGAARMMSTYYAGLLADVGILLLGALSVYIILATGQLSLGNAGFMGIGAYLTSYLTVIAGVPVTPALVIAALAVGRDRRRRRLPGAAAEGHLSRHGHARLRRDGAQLLPQSRRHGRLRAAFTACTTSRSATSGPGPPPSCC